jgi:glycosyltransferase involved in cell wall biosynthesis
MVGYLTLLLKKSVEVHTHRLIIMKIAILAPSAVPFRIGGAENLWWGLLHHINQHTPHQADLIKMPSPESNFWELIDNYWQFSQLDLGHFDLVISGKYPSWMVQHPNHVCYMLHKLRGLYDTYPASWPETYITDNREISSLQKFMQQNKGTRAALSEFYQKINQIRSYQEHLPADAFQFPGPLIREIVHYLDSIGLAPSAIKKYAAIAHNVANRKDYFPIGCPAEAIYPPPILKNLRAGKSDYLFTASRLEYGSKRICILIEAMKYVKTDIQFKIAGVGDELNDLRKLAGNDPRITFLGFVNDRELEDLYADAFAILYIPYDEDYGLITVEAMMSGKPVITAIDSGGTNEFVRNGETGYSVPPSPQAIAERIDYLCQNREEAQRMGVAGKQLVQNITWENGLAKLLSETPPPSLAVTVRKRPKITVALTYPIFPPSGGGQSRVFHLYRHLAKKFDIELVTFTDNGQPFNGEIAPGVWETRIPMSPQHLEAETAIRSQTGILQITDVVMPQLYHLTPAYLEALRKAASDSNFMVACNSYLLPAIQEVSNQPIWYEAHDVQVEVKKSIFSPYPKGNELLEATRQVENECCQVSQLIMVCCQNDALRMKDIYGVDSNKFVEVPNGGDLESVSYISLEKRILKKKQLGLYESFTALFIGSWHQPNVEAVRYILSIASHLPQVNFLILGNICWAFPAEQLPLNVSFMGLVNDAIKDVVLGVADVALNPMISGSGTNLKMLDYLAAGIPVISTPFGARGLNLEHGQHCFLAEIDQFTDAIRYLAEEDSYPKIMRIENARQYVEQKYDWAVIANNFLAYLKHLQLCD